MIATGSGILCPACGHPENDVTDSRPGDNYVRRRRKCRSCNERYTTIEIRVVGTAITDPIMQAIRFQAGFGSLPAHEQEIIRSMLAALLAKGKEEQP